MNNIISYSKEIIPIKIVLGIVSLLCGFWMLISGGIVLGFVIFFIGVNFFSSEGSQIDLDNKTYRKTKTIFGNHFGKWQTCPKFDYVSVFITKENQTINVITASATFSAKVILLNMFYNTNKHITFYKTNDIEDAFKVANHFKLVFDIDILDATRNDKVWL